MIPYADEGGDSGVAGYETGDYWIRVRFKDDSVYFYTNDSAGSENVERMKALAAAGEGLNSFISSEVRTAYARQER
jgi:hypothetical protein